MHAMVVNANQIRKLHEIGQSVWLDNISRSMISSGALHKSIEAGVTGLTSNPTIFHKAITTGVDYDDDLTDLARAGKNKDDIFEALAVQDIIAAADALRTVYDQTKGVDGYVSLEVNPHLANDRDGTIIAVRRLWAAVGRPNVLIKVPGTMQGISAIEVLIGEGININITLIFSLEAYSKIRIAYIRGLENFRNQGGDLSTVFSVASFFISRIDTEIDLLLAEQSQFNDETPINLKGKAAISNAQLAYRDFKKTFDAPRFSFLKELDARVQRPLWASTSTKNLDYRDVLYVEQLIGPDTVNTMPNATLDAFLDHGVVCQTLDQDVDEAEFNLKKLQSVGIDMDQVTAKLLSDGVKAFEKSYDALVEDIENKRVALQQG